MRTTLLLALLMLGGAMFIGGAARADDKKPAPSKDPNAPYPPEWRKRVTKAVDDGVEHLLSKQAADGSWLPVKEQVEWRLGYTALVTLACLKGGITGRDMQIRKAFKWMRTRKLNKTYEVGVLLMALHALYSPTDERKIVEVDKYGNRKIKDPCLTDMTPDHRKWMKEGVQFLIKHQVGGHWRYPEDGLDTSNTQYALLGLWAASRCGLKIPAKVWMDSLNWLMGTQERTGRSVRLLINEVRGDYRVAWTEKARARGFRYTPDKPVTGAMTTAGMAGMAICQDELWSSRKFKPEMRKASRRAIRDSLAWMQDNFDVARNPGEPGGGWHFYYLYGMERAGILARARFMGKHDWYKEGADFLMQKQRSDGSWRNEGDQLADTAFAVLFLKRSTSRTRNPVITHTAK